MAVILLACANLAAQTSPPAKGTALPKPAGVLIQGVLSGSDGVPLQLDGTQLMLTFVFAIPVTKEEERSPSVSLRAEDLNRFRAQPDGQGRFRLRINRKDVPKDRKVRLLVMLPASGSGMQSLQKGGQDILIDIAAAPVNLNLGKVTIGSLQRD